MHNITFEFTGLHQHGNAFWEYLALRKTIFVDQMNWDIPHNDKMEMDQYDTPVAHYSLVLDEGRVIGGARAMATTAIWGQHTYMLRDAFTGKLPHIPPEVMTCEIASPMVWECTRLLIADDVTGQRERADCLRLIVDGLVAMAREQGASELISLSPLALQRALRGLGYEVSRLGELYRNDEDGRHYAVLRMPARFANGARAITRPGLNMGEEYLLSA